MMALNAYEMVAFNTYANGGYERLLKMVALNTNENGRLNNYGNGGIVALKAYGNGESNCL